MSDPDIERRLRAAFAARADAVSADAVHADALHAGTAPTDAVPADATQARADRERPAARQPAARRPAARRLAALRLAARRLAARRLAARRLAARRLAARRPVAWPPAARRLAAPIAVALLLVGVLGGVFLRFAPAPPPEHASLEGVAFEVPGHWTYRPLAEGIGCLSPPEVSVVDGACGPEAVQIQVGAFVGWPADALDLDDGWSGVAKDCRAAGLTASDAEPPAQRLVTRERRLVGERAGDYRVWQVRCDGAPEFSPRLWWRADVSLTVFTIRMDPRYDSAVDAFVGGLRIGEK